MELSTCLPNMVKDDELFLQSTKTFSILPTSSPKSYSPALNGFSPKFVSHENLSDSISNSTSPPWTPRTLPSCQDVGLSLYTFVSNFEHLYTSVRNHEQLIIHMCPISSNFTHWCAMMSRYGWSGYSATGESSVMDGALPLWRIASIPQLLAASQ